MLIQRKAVATDETNLNLHFLVFSPLKQTDKFKYLGVWLETDLSFKTHIQKIANKINYSLETLYQSVTCFNFLIRKRIVIQLLLPILDYANIIYLNTTASCLSSLSVVYNSLCRFILHCPYRTHHCAMYHQLSWLTLLSVRLTGYSLYLNACTLTIPHT